MSAVLQYSIHSIRPMAESDVSSIAIIERNAYPFPWAESTFTNCLRVGHCCWVMENDGMLVAYGVMSLGAGESHLLNLCVHPEYQNKGLGKTLLAHLLNMARKNNIDIAFLEVRPSNFRAIRLYLDNGFNEVGMRRNYYPAKIGREDALILARPINTGAQP